MPIYVYQCEQGHRKEEWRRISEMDDPVTCDCSLPMKKIITPVQFTAGFLGSARNPGYQCPVTNEWVESKRKRRNIMAKHDLVEYSGKRPKAAEA